MTSQVSCSHTQIQLKTFRPNHFGLCAMHFFHTVHNNTKKLNWCAQSREVKSHAMWGLSCFVTHLCKIQGNTNWDNEVLLLQAIGIQSNRIHMLKFLKQTRKLVGFFKTKQNKKDILTHSSLFTMFFIQIIYFLINKSLNFLLHCNTASNLFC